MVTGQTLRQLLKQLEGCSYREYKGIKGNYEFSDFLLIVDYVQADPFAPPSRIRIQLKQAVAKFPPNGLTHYESQVAIADYLTRQVAQVAQLQQKKRGSGNSGQIAISAPSQAILRRSSMWITADGVEARLTVGLPALGRRIAGHAAADLLCEDISQIVASALKYEALDPADLAQHVQTFEDAEALRSQLAAHNLVAFIAEGACLPRRSGIDQRSLTTDVARFSPPADHCVELETVHSGKIKGLGIRQGVSLIVGGGYHGKSTLLSAIEQGVYNHVPGDGRQQVVTAIDAVKLRAEDGRSVVGVDISPVISPLPRGQLATNFSTTNASGSTSQAAGLMEAIEVGAKVVLIDEDTAATNFMIRDRNMQTLIPQNKEPITPFVDKVRQLYDDYGISTILVMGGSGDYFAVADTVIAMEDYQPRIVTAAAKAIAAADIHQRQAEGGEHFGAVKARAVLPESVDMGDRLPSVKTTHLNALTLGNETIDLNAIEQIVEVHQVCAIAHAILYAQRHYFDSKQPLSKVLDHVMQEIDRYSLDVLTGEKEGSGARYLGNLAQFRRFEFAAAINRLRTLKTISVS